MNPREFLDVAGDWVVGEREAEWRSAVSRAYYAAFHVARGLLRDCLFIVPLAEQAHGYLWLRLANSGHPDVQQAGNDLRYLREQRNRADYDLEHPLDQDAALRHVQLALDVVRLLIEVAAAPTTRAAITDAIKIYERDVLRQVTWRP